MSAIVPKNGAIRQLDGPAGPEEQVTEEEVKDVPHLARRLMGLLRDVATLKRRWWPQHIDYEDVSVDDTNTTKYRLPHGFKGRVRWWVIDWQSSAGGGFWLDRSDDTNANTLVFTSGVSGVVSIRVEEVG